METKADTTLKVTGAERLAGPYMQTLIAAAKKVPPKNIAAVFPDDVALSAINNAIGESIINHVYIIGNKEYLTQLLLTTASDVSSYTIIESDPESADADVTATLMAVDIINTNKAHMIMKGKMNTASFVKGVLDKEKGIGAEVVNLLGKAELSDCSESKAPHSAVVAELHQAASNAATEYLEVQPMFGLSVQVIYHPSSSLSRQTIPEF